MRWRMGLSSIMMRRQWAVRVGKDTKAIPALDRPITRILGTTRGRWTFQWTLTYRGILVVRVRVWEGRVRECRDICGNLNAYDAPRIPEQQR